MPHYPKQPTMSKPAADYRKATGTRHCATCSMFRAGNHCTLVKGSISPNGVCKYWEAR